MFATISHKTNCSLGPNEDFKPHNSNFESAQPYDTGVEWCAKEERLLYDTLAYKKNKVFGTKPKVTI